MTDREIFVASIPSTSEDTTRHLQLIDLVYLATQMPIREILLGEDKFYIDLDFILKIIHQWSQPAMTPLNKSFSVCTNKE